MQSSSNCSYCYKDLTNKNKIDPICKCVICYRCASVFFEKQIRICSMCQNQYNFGNQVYNNEVSISQVCRELPRNPHLDQNLDQKLSRIISLAHQVYNIETNRKSFEILGVFDKIESIKSSNLMNFYNMGLSAYNSTFCRLNELKKKYFDELKKNMPILNQTFDEIARGGHELGFCKLGKLNRIFLSINGKSITISGLGIILAKKSILNGRIKGVKIGFKGNIIFQSNIEFDNVESTDLIYELALEPNIVLDQESPHYEVSFDLDEGYYFTMKHDDFFFNNDLPISINASTKESLLAYIRYK